MSTHKRQPDQQSSTSITQAKPARRKHERKRLLEIESLERRVVLSQDMWTGALSSNWQTAGNWSAGVPTSTSSVLINVTGNPTITDSANTTIANLVDDDSLSITGGTFTITSGTSSVAGALTVGSGATLIINGTGATFTDGTSTTINSANLYAENGANLSLSGVTAASNTSLEASAGAALKLANLATFTQPNNAGVTLEATGNGSLLSLPALTSITNSTNSNQVEAFSGGDIEMKALTQSTGNVVFQTNSSTSTLDAPLLTTFNGGTINDNGGGNLNVPVLANINSSTVEASGAVTFSLPDVTAAINTSLEASGGAALKLPNLAAFTQPINSGVTLEATGTGSLLSLPALTSIANSTNSNQVEAFSGGDIEMTALTQSTGNVVFQTNSSTSILDAPLLTTFNGGTINDNGGGNLNVPVLANINSSTVKASGAVTVSLPDVTAAINSSLEASGGATLKLPNLAAFTQPNNSGVTLEATGTGSLLSLPALASITNSTNSNQVEAFSGGDIEMTALTQSTGNVVFQTNSATSTLDAPLLTTFTSGTLDDNGGGNLNVPVLANINSSTVEASGAVTVSLPDVTAAINTSLEASGGAALKLANLATFTQPNNSGVTLEATGTGSLLSLPALTSITNSTNSNLVAAFSGGDIEMTALTQSTGNVEFETNSSTSILDAPLLTTFTGGTIIDSAGNLNVSTLANINSSTVEVSGGVSLSLPDVTAAINTSLYVSGGATLKLANLATFTQPNNSGVTLEATGTGSLLSLPALTSITNSTNSNQVEALSGGDIEMTALTQSTGNVIFQTNSPSTLDMPMLETLTGGTINDNGVNLSLPVLADINSSTVELSGGITVSLPDVTAANSSNFELSGGVTVSMPDVNAVSASSFEVSGGASLKLATLASYTEPNSFSSSTLEATGAGSLLSLPELASIAVTAGYTTTYVEALSGGDVELPSLTQSTGSVSLQTNSATSTLDAPLLATFTSGTLSDSGGTMNVSMLADVDYSTFQISGGVTLSLPDVTAVNAPNFEVSGGATLKLPALASYTEPNSFSSSTLEATGANSLLSLPELTSIAVTAGYTTTYVEALSAGDVELPLVTQLSGSVAVEGENSGSVVDLPTLANFNGGSLTVTSQGKVVDPDLTALNSVGVTLDGTGTLAIAQWATLTNGSLTITGGSYTFAGLTNINASNLTAEAGTSLTLSALASYTEPNSFSSSTLEATGAGSLLSLPDLASIAVTAGYTTTYVEAFSSGDVEIPSLTQSTGSVSLQTNSSASTLDAPLLATFTGGTLSDSGGTMNVPVLTDVDNSTFQISSGVTLSLPDVTAVNAPNFEVSGGATLKLPALASYTEPNSFSSSTLEATGANSLLSLPELTSIAVTAGYTTTYVEALSGGDVELPLVTQLSGSVAVEGENSGSVVDLPSLANFNGGSLTVTGQGTVLDPDLTSLNSVGVTLDGTGTLAIAQWATLTNGSLTITGGSYTFAGLTNISASNLTAEAGTSLTLPAVTTYTEPNSFSSSTLEATGVASLLSLPELASIAVTAGYTTTYVEALSAGDVELPALTQVYGPVDLESEDAGSVLDLSTLTSLTGNGGSQSLTITQGGTLLDPNLTIFANVTITTDATGTFTVPANQTFTFPSGTTTFSTGTLLDQGNLQLGRTEVFKLANYTGGGTGVIQTPGQANESTYDIPVNITDPTTVFTLINSGYGEAGDIVGSVEFKATGGLDYTVNLVEGQNIRDHNNGGYENSIGSGALGSTYVGTAYYGNGQVRLDEQEFILPSSFDSATLTDIILHGLGNVPDGEPFLAAATVATSSGPVQVGISSLVNANLQTYSNGGDYPPGGSLVSTGNATLNVEGALTINGQGGLSVSSVSTLDVSGNLLGNTTNASAFNPIGTVDLDSGNGTSNPPQQLEAMSEDLGNTSAGFTDNFAYGTLVLTSNTYVELVDLAANSPGNAPQALYVNDLIIDSGATLNLDGLHLYVRSETNNGTIVAGGAVVSGEVYDDASGSGSLQNGDGGLVGVSVVLTNTATNSTYSTTTNSSGLYSLTGIASGTYKLSEVLPNGFTQSQPTSPGTYTVTVTSGQTVTGENFGDHPTASISGEVFNDLNGDGTLESGEPALSGFTVKLLNSSSQVVGSVTTTSSGTYSFTSLLPGSYTVQVVSQAGYVASSSSSVGVSDTTGAADTVNFGEFATVSISGKLTSDTTGSGLSGWTIDLTSGGQTVPTTTASNGTFSFTNVGPGGYTIAAVQQTGYVASPGPINGSTTSGTNISGLSLGEFATVTISGEVFNDLVDSGMLNGNDPGLAGWTIDLTKGAQVVQTTTNSSGAYSFANVGPGTYTLSEVLQPGYVQTTPGAGGYSVTTSSGVNVSGDNFGVIQAALLSVTNLGIAPTTIQSGTSLVVSWDDTNAGNSPITTSFIDHVTITNLATNQVLGVADIPYNVNTRGSLNAGASAAQQYSFQLPNGTPGVGNIQFTVTADNYDAVSGGLNANGRTSTIDSTSTLAHYADLATSNISAPATSAPGKTVSVSWTDSNLGNASTPASWVDEILLSYDGTIANAIPVGTIAVTSAIASNSSSSEQASVTIPATGAVSSGSLQFVIISNVDQSFFELNTANNAAIDPAPTIVPLTLTLTSAVNSINENASNPNILGTIARNGPTSQALTVNLASSSPSQFSVPATVTIPAGQSMAPVTITVLDDGIDDPDQTDTITATANAFQNGSVAITDINTDTANLTVTFPTSGSTVAKGSYLTATVTRTGTDAQAAVVTLSTNTPNKIFVPAAITIPAGMTSATFNVQAINDDEIEGTQTYAFTASAPGLTQGIGDVNVTDTDIPTLGLSLSPTTVSEAAGPLATIATLTVATASDVPVIVDLSVPAGSPVTVPSSVTIPANKTSITFSVGTVNNGSSQTIQAVPITAEVTTVTNDTPLTQGSATATLDVVNSNGPLLSVTFANPVVTQGEASATLGTVTLENASAPTSPLTVTLTTSDPTEANVPSTVIIPAGSTSATFTITTPADTLNRGTVEPTISASAANFAPGQAQLIVTDTTLPNVVVSTLTVPSTALNGQTFTIQYTVTNQGSAPAKGPWQDAVYITNQATGGVLTELGTVDYNGIPLQPGVSYSRALTYFAPEETGDYYIVVQTDSDGLLAEATTANDERVSANPVDVLPSYTATVQADVSVSPTNTPVPLSGSATLAGGGPAQYQIVNIHILTGGSDRIISAITDAAGLFSAEFDPLPGEAGVYTIGAVNPGVSEPTVQGGFDILGMSATPPTETLSLVAGASAVGGQVTLTNLTDIPLSDLQATIVGAPSNLDVSATLGNGSPDQGLAGSGTLTLSYLASATGLSTPSGSFTIDVTSTEGATVAIPVSFTVISQQPDIVASPTSLQAGMLIGNQTIVQLTLDNEGGGASGPLQIILPNQPAGSAFLSLAMSSTIASIAPGGSTQVTLLLTPPAGLPLGTYTGSIVVEGASGSTSIPFTFLNQSTATGSLDITTVDEYTFYAQGSPNLAGADVTVTSALTNAVVASGVTNAQGMLDLSSLPEGYYNINATASGHDPYNGSVLVSAGQTTPVSAFLSLQLVTTTFTVAPTSVQDNIAVTVNTTFETNVPAPVITATPSVFNVGPLTAVGDTEQVNLVIANHGLIAALNMMLNFGSHPYYSITPLISDIGTLPAESSLTIPVILKRISVTDTGDVPCSIPANLTWQLESINNNFINYDLELAVINVQGDCAPGKGTDGGLLGFIGGGGAAGSVVYQSGAIASLSDCNPLETATNAALLQFPTFPDWASAGAGLGNALAGGATNVVADASGFLSALVTYLQATPDVGNAVSLIDTSDAIIQDWKNGVYPSSVTPPIEQLMTFTAGFQSLVNESVDIFGSTDWINPYSGPELTKWLTAFASDASGGQAITSGEASALESMTLPEEVTLTDVQNFIARWNQTITYNAQGVYDSTQVPVGGTANFIPRDVWAGDLQATASGETSINTIGDASFSSAILYEMQQIETDTTVSTPIGGICTQVQLQLNQNLVVTRQAFDATLEIQDDKTTPITNIGLTIVVHDAQGNVVTDLFDIETPNLTGLTAVDGTGMVAAGTTGQAVYTIVPTINAAPTVATFYYVSAVLTYQVNGTNLSIPFAAQTITVDPSPSLTLRYFEQSAVYADDPYTSAVEPSQPFVLGVQVVNTGAGAANNVSITSAQPQIVSNVSGLLVNFQLLATQVDGQSLSPSLTVDFGDIAPGAVGEAQFLLTSSIDGQFVSYNATFQDQSGLGSPQLSIINAVDIYNLIHLASEVGQGASTGTAFLVSDVPGASSLPDAVFLPDGSVAPVAQATDVSTQGTLGAGSLTVHLTDTAASGWNYLDIPDPDNGNYRLVGVTRSDGVSLPVNDFWQTDETYVSDGQPPVFENDLHILDDNGTGSYTLTYVPIDQLQPSVTSISAVTPNPTSTAVPGLQVTFNEPIALNTLNANALDLSLNGGSNLIGSNSNITVTLVSGSTYQINGLAALDTSAGSYTLTVNASAVEDPYGNPGTGTASTSWVMDAGAPAVVTIGGVSPGPRNTPVGSVSVTFNEAIDTSSFGLAALSLTDNGGSNLITSNSGVTITQQGPDTFQINGLSSLTTANGNYVLTVYGSDVTANGVPGVGSDSVSWTMDTTPPLVSSFSTITSPRNTDVTSVNVTFSKLINPSTFTDAALALTLNGGANLINSGVTIALVSGSTYAISGLSALDAANGTYLLTVFGADVSDLAGNAGTNSLSTSWLMNTSIPASPTNLAISPNTGITPGLTDTGTLTLTGKLGATGLTVDVFDLTTDTDLGAATVNGTNFSMPLNLPSGSTELAVTDEDSAGNVSTAADFSIFVDRTPPTISTVTAVTANPTNTPVSDVDVTFSKPINLATFTIADLSLTDDGGPNLITSAATISLVSGSTYQIGNLAALTIAEGTYTFTVNASGLQDQAGNAGIGSSSASWLMDTTPPTSTVAMLPAQTASTSILVMASGNDPEGADGGAPSGIASYALYVSDNGGAFTEFATVTPASPSALFNGQAGHTYGFYSVAIDNAGNVQATPSGAQTTVQFISPLSLVSITGVAPNPRNASVTSVDVTFSEPINVNSLSPGALTLTDDGGPNLINSGVTLALVSGDTYAIMGLTSLTGAEGTYTLTVNAADLRDQNGDAGSGSLATSWLMDTTAPTSHVVNTLGATQTSDTFPVTVSFTDPTALDGGAASGVSSVSLYVSVNNGPFTLYQTISFAPTASGSQTFMFTGQDRNLYAFHSVAQDAAGNTESKPANAIEASTSVPDLNPPVTHVQNTSSYSSGVFSINWAGTDPDQNSGTPAGSIVTVDIYVKVDGGNATLFAQVPAGTPSGGVYSGTVTYNALADGQSHTYSFYSIGIDDQQKTQATPSMPDVTFSNITYTASLTTQPITVEKGIVGRSFIQYLDVDFNQTASTSPALQALASGLTGNAPTVYVELLWYGENLTPSSVPEGSVNLFGGGTTATVALNGNDLSINFGSNGLTSLLTENGVSGTGSPTSKFGDGWYALGIDPTGNPSNGQVFWKTFYRLLGDANGTGTVTGPYTTPGTDASNVYHAEGQSGSLLSTDVDGNGVVNSKDFSETVLANNDAVGSVAPTNFPMFQLFAGASTQTNAIAVTQAQVQSLLPLAIEAWAKAGLDAADIQKLEAVKVQVANLGTSILGLEAANTILINQTAAGQSWYLGASPSSSLAGKVDLLTVLEHELGHVLDLQDNNTAGDLMDITLGLGVSRSPSTSDVAAAEKAAETLIATNPIPSRAETPPSLRASSPTPSTVLKAGPAGVVVPLSTSAGQGQQSSSANRVVSQATVDAALESLLGEASDQPAPIVQGIVSTPPVGRVSAFGVIRTGKGQVPQSPLFLAPTSVLKVLRPAQTSPLGPEGTAN